MSKKSFNMVMRELKKIEKQMDKEASHEKFMTMKAQAKNERAANKLAKSNKKFDIYSDDKFDVSELGINEVALHVNY